MANNNFTSVVRLVISFIVFCTFLAFCVGRLNYLINTEGIYIFMDLLVLLVITHSIYNICDLSKPQYHIRELPYVIPISLLGLLIYPLFTNNGYPPLNDGMIYYTFLSIPIMLLFSDFLVWISLSIRKK